MQRDNVTKKVNILGDANVDMILNLSDKQNLGEPSLFSGGSSANVASGLSKLGIDVSFFGSLGKDIYGKHVVDEMKADGIDQIVVLPLYPHFSISTSGSSFRELKKLRDSDSDFKKIPMRCIRSWFSQSGYLKSMVELISEQILLCESPSNAHIFFTAHGVPKSYVEEAGDPYKQQIEDCSLLIINELEKYLGHSNSHTLSYQSRVGPVEWLKPYTEEVLEDLGRSKVNDLIVVPISFVGEHIETLQEIDIEYKEIAEKAGIKNFRRVKALNTHPTFIEGLSDLVVSCLEEPLVNIEEASQLPEKVKLYPQEKWQWGWNNSSEVWNGRVAMIVFLILFIELISGSGPLHRLGIL